jgi:hypothetical protein
MQSQNRKSERSHLHKNRFHGESKNVHLTVIGSAKYKRIVQLITNNKAKLKDADGNLLKDEDGDQLFDTKPRKIYHYQLVK